MVKAKVSFLADKDALKLKSGGKTTRHVMPNKLSSAERTKLLSTIYERTHSAAKSPIPRRISQNDNANGGSRTERGAVQMSNSLGGQRNHQTFPSKSVPESLKNKCTAEDRPGKRVALSADKESSSYLTGRNDSREKVGLLSNHIKGFASGRSVSGALEMMNGVEDRLGKQAPRSGNTKSSPDQGMSRSRRYNDGSEGTSLSPNKETRPSPLVGQNFRPGFSPAQSITGGLISAYGDVRSGKQVSPSLLRSKEYTDDCKRVKLTEVPRKKLIFNDDPLDDVIMPANEARASSRMEHPTTDVASLVPEDSWRSGNTSSCHTNHESQKMKSPNIFSGSLNYPQSGPAIDIIWKGTFEVLNLSHEMGLCEGFLARPSLKACEKAHKFSRQIAGVLLFKLEPRCRLWPKIFQIRCPDWSDVALFFYPEKSESSKRKYSHLLRFMEKNDLVLRILMGRVELLVFGSKSLALDCQLLNNNYFMWGVFRALKGRTRQEPETR